jgi:hypothetical protein
MQIAQGGCRSLGDLSDAIGEAGDAGTTQPLQDFETSNEYTLIANLALLNNVPPYQQLGTDAGPFASDYAAAVSSNDLSTLEALETTITGNCQSLGLAIGNSN